MRDFFNYSNRIIGARLSQNIDFFLKHVHLLNRREEDDQIVIFFFTPGIHIYSDISPIKFNGIYSQGNIYRIWSIALPTNIYKPYLIVIKTDSGFLRVTNIGSSWPQFFRIYGSTLRVLNGLMLHNMAVTAVHRQFIRKLFKMGTDSIGPHVFHTGTCLGCNSSYSNLSLKCFNAQCAVAHICSQNFRRK